MSSRFAAFDGDGELYGMSDDPRAGNPWFWADALAEDSGCTLVELRDVPPAALEIARNGVGRAAAEVLRPYIHRVILSFP